MKSIELSEALISNIVDMNSLLYQKMFEEELLDDEPRKDLAPDFRQSLDIYAMLSEEQQAHLIRRFRQITVDSISNILGVIDGSSTFDGVDGEFTLTYDGIKVGDDDLQDVFLECIEDIEQ